MRMSSFHWGLLIALLVTVFVTPTIAKKTLVSIVTDKTVGAPVEHGLSKVTASLEAKGIEVERVTSISQANNKKMIIACVAANNGAAAKLLVMQKGERPRGTEALSISRLKKGGGRSIVLACGSDERGLMYALLDIAKRIEWAPKSIYPFSQVTNISEKPYVAERALSTYTVHREYAESIFYDEEYWSRYLDMLAENRFNTFVYILGYQPSNPYSPAYPFFFDVEGYDDVYVEDLSKKEQKKNLDTLNRLIEMTHDRGMDFTLGIWDHIPRQPEHDNPVGITPDNAPEYTKAAIAKLLKVVPEADAIQFRMHWESGLSRSEEDMLEFWRSVFEGIKKSGSDIRFDFRAKGLPDSVIDLAVKMDMNFRITTKYWAEQMGLPFHPTHINKNNQHDRRHQYADLLRYPKRYDMHWKLWNAGTTKFLLWADPDYVRRFVGSTHLYDGDGFEVNAHLATKMAMHPKEKPFDLMKEPYRYYDYEFERYWHFYQVFGRVAYNPGTSPRFWKEEFRARFGDEAAVPLEKAIHLSSKVLPRIIGAVMIDFPTMSGFPEKKTGGSLENYSKTLPSDIQIFMSMKEAAELIVSGEESAKVWPQQTSEWFAETSKEILKLAAEAEKTIGEKKGKEFESTIVDLKILAHLAEFHSHRLEAGVAYQIFVKSKDVTALNEAILYEGKAIIAYEKIVEAAGDVYADDLMFGRSQPPHWRDELVILNEDFNKLMKQRKDARGKGTKEAKYEVIFGQPPLLSHEPIKSADAGKKLRITASVSNPDGVKWVRLLYRSVTQFEDYKILEMVPTNRPNEYAVTVPAGDVDPAWDFMYLFEVMDKAGNGKIYPDFEKETPYIVVKLKRK